jgi:hypothetical protein
MIFGGLYLILTAKKRMAAQAPAAAAPKAEAAGTETETRSG